MRLSQIISERFDRLVSAASSCVFCASMDGQKRVLTHANGSPSSLVMLIGEAPGRYGAGRTGRPFDGDASGRRLDRRLSAAGLSRESVFLTNAVLCNPLDGQGRNRAPTRREIRNCTVWLRRQIDVINPALVVALGVVALGALRTIEDHNLSLKNAADVPVPWFGRALAARYHPGARAAIHRPVERQVQDFSVLGKWLLGINAGSDAYR